MQVLNNSMLKRNKDKSTSIKFNVFDYNNDTTIITNDLPGGNSICPSITIDEDGGLHIVWEESGIWYNYYNGSEWSGPIKISQSSSFWNGMSHISPDIAIDNNGTIHIVWQQQVSYPLIVTSSDISSPMKGISPSPSLARSEIFYCFSNGTGWSDNYIISQNINDQNYGGNSYHPSIAVDSNGKIHVVWYDYARGPWSSTCAITYTSNNGLGWTNPHVISSYDISTWSGSLNYDPDIHIDYKDLLHIVWSKEDLDEDDYDIRYIYGDGYGWSNEIIISDDNRNWNDGPSSRPSITGDNDGNIYVVWEDGTDGAWGTDTEIMFSSKDYWGQWSTPIVISDDKTKWNNGGSYIPSITVDNSGKIHIVWEDYTTGVWGTDSDILYTHYDGIEWSEISIISDNKTNWNDEDSHRPSIAVDNNGRIHVVWEDDTFISGIFYSSTNGYLLEIDTSNRTVSFGNIFIFTLTIGISIIFVLLRNKYKILIKR